MAHLSGSIGTACYIRGAATATLRSFDAATTLRAVEDLGVTVLPLVPTMLRALTAEAETGRYDLSSLRAFPTVDRRSPPGPRRRHIPGSVRCWSRCTG